MIHKLKAYIREGKFLVDRKLAILLWFGLSLIAILLTYFHHTGFNNYLIFKQVYYHTLAQKNLYVAYPTEYGDVNLYGPVFAIVIAPFAILPDIIGSALWVLFSSLFLFYAILKLPIKKEYCYGIVLFSALEMMNVASYFHSNAFIAACIILGFVFVNKGKDWLGLLFILLATFIKIYGIVGLAFFFFSKDKWHFIFWVFSWCIVLFLLPMILSSPQFIFQSYINWFEGLVLKAGKNVNLVNNNFFQDISVMGMCRRIFNLNNLKDSYILVPAVVVFFIQYIRFSYFDDIRFRLYLLCSVLLFVVIFSSGSESPTYIIAFPAICIWYFLQHKSRWVNAFFGFAFLLTCLSYSDILTPFVRNHLVRPFALKALPSFITWLIICIQMYSKQFLTIDLQKTIPICVK